MDSLPIQPYDIVMLAVLVLTTLFGLWKGMAWQLASLGSLVLSCVVAMRFSGPLAPYVSSHEPWNRFIAMLILYLVTSLAIWLVFRLVAGVIDRVRLKEFDRQMGALFGLAKGCLLCLVITFFAVTLSETVRQAVLKSKSGKYIAVAIQKATPAMPQEVRDVLGKYIDQLDEKLAPNTPPDSAPLERTIGGSLPSLPSADAAGEPSLGDKIKADVTGHVKSEIDRHVDEEIKRLDQGLDSLKSGIQSRLDEGLNSIKGQIDARTGQGLEAIDFSRWLVEPAGASTLVALPGYRVGPSDVLKIRQVSPAAPGSQTVDGLYQVASDGSLRLGSYGKVSAAGQRLADVEHEIEARLAQTLPGADVSLEVAAAESEVYYVVAAAEQGGKLWRLRARGNETIGDAVRAAGTPPQAIEKIWLVHPTMEGGIVQQALPVGWDPGRAQASPNYRVAPGDAVFLSGRNSPWANQTQDWVAAWLQWLRR